MPAFRGEVEPPPLERLREVRLVDLGVFEVVGIPVVFPVSQGLHQGRGGVSKVQGNREGAGFPDGLPGFSIGRVEAVALWGGGQVDGGLHQGQLPFRRTHEPEGLHGVHGDGQRLGVGAPDIFCRKPDHPSGKVQGIFPRGQHARQPVDSRVRIAVPQALVQGRDQVVVLLTRLVVQERFFLEGLLQVFKSDDAAFPGERGAFLGQDHRCGQFKAVEGCPRVAVGDTDEVGAGFGF